MLEQISSSTHFLPYILLKVCASCKSEGLDGYGCAADDVSMHDQ